MSRKNKPATKDMYWFAHGGTENLTEKYLTQGNNGEDENDSNSLVCKNNSERGGMHGDQRPPSCSKDVSLTDGSNSSGPPSLERDDRLHVLDKRIAVEERKKQLLEAEQERNDAVLRKHMEREAALEARRNAQRSHIAFAFGSSVPRNVDSLQTNQSAETDIMSRSFTATGLSNKGDDLMTRSMIASISATRGRRKNDLMPTVPYNRTPTPRVATSSSSRRRSVSMTRLDQLALPRKHYVEATKANSTASSGASSMMKDVSSPNRPLSSASEHSLGRAPNNVTRRVRSSPRKPRPVSIAGTIPDQKYITNAKSPETKVTPAKRTTYTPIKKTVESVDTKKAHGLMLKNATPKATEKVKSSPRPATATIKTSTSKSTPTKPAAVTKQATPKQVKQKNDKNVKAKPISLPSNSAPKIQALKNSATNKRQADIQTSSLATSDIKDKSDCEEKSGSPLSDSEAVAESDKNNKRIISEEEARSALAEKRRLAREQAEKEAELERQKQEELRLQEEERLRKEEEDQRKLEEEQLYLLEEHRRQEAEKLRKAIEDQEQREEEERVKRDEELRMKAEQEKKAKEESEKLRLEMEEKLRKEEEERAERKKRLEKIMSRTRGKSSATSPSGSISGSDQLDSGENQQEGFSSGANSLESNDGGDPPSEGVSSDDAMAKMEVSSGGNSIEAYEFGSNDVSLNSNDLMLPVSETASEDNSMVIIPDKGNLPAESADITDTSGTVTPMNLADKLEMCSQLQDDTAELDFQTEKSPASLEKEIGFPENVAQLEDQKHKAEEELMDNCSSDGISKAKFITEEPSAHSSPLESIADSTEIQHNGEPDFQELLDEKEVLQSSHIVAEDPEIDYLDTAQNEPLIHKDEMLQNSNDLNIPKSDLYNTESDDLTKGELDNIPFKSENMQQNFAFNEFRNEMNFQNTDDFSTFDNFQDTKMTESFHPERNAVEAYSNPFSDQNPLSGVAMNEDFVHQASLDQTQVNKDFTESIFDDNLVDKREPIEVAEESVIISQSSAVLNGESGFEKNSEFSMNALDENEKQVKETISAEEFLNQNSSNYTFHQDEDSHLASVSNFEDDEITSFKQTAIDAESTEENSFVSNPFACKSELNMFQPEIADSIQEPNIVMSEQTDNCKVQIVDNSSELSVDEELSNVILIKKEGCENLVGLISSIDNDKISNSFNKVTKQLTNDFECASTTDDSEDSSLDSNLSQIIAAEDGVQNTDSSLNQVENFIFENNSLHTGSNNVQHSDNLFKTDFALDPTSIQQPTLNHYSASNMYSNGHSVEALKTASDHNNEHHNFVQLDSNGILSVDHSKNNIFENADAIDYGKVSPDPFLVKGSSKQISGNPFLLQDEQNQVLMTSDFLN